MITKNITHIWYKKNFFSFLLIPFSMLYRLIVFIRLLLFQWGILKTVRFPVPIIVIGNITVGGTGKTPLVIWLANYLQQQGWNPGIVSRGYGGKSKSYPEWVRAESDPRIVSDEAVLIASKTTCPVVIDPKRVRAVDALYTTKKCDIIISDDGLQHYALERDVNIAVIDGQRGFGNGFCLPSGPLREPIHRLGKVDFLIINKKMKKQTWNLKTPAYHMSLTPLYIYNLLDKTKKLQPIETHQHSIHAVAGIGNPESFFSTLSELGYKFQQHAFPDHYLYQSKDLAFGDDALIIMTEKDAVKCHEFAKPNVWCLSVEAKVEDQFAEHLTQLLKKRLIKK